MIPIKNPNLSKYAKEHSNIIVDYYNQKRNNPLRSINKWIQNNLGKNYSFEQILQLSEGEQFNLISQYNRSAHQIPNVVKGIKNLYQRFSVVAKSPFKQTDGSSYNAYILVDKLGITVCPYCNRNYIFNIPTSNRRTSQLDHFYSKDQYPFLSLSFYNLIPCCSVCNHLKSNSRAKFFSPYDYTKTSNELLTFSIKIKGINYLDEIKDLSLNLTIDKDFHNNANTFSLSEIYSKHLDLVQEILKKKHIYNDDYIKQMFQDYGGLIVNNKGDLINLILSSFILEEELHKRPFAKLTKDIWEEVQAPPRFVSS